MGLKADKNYRENINEKESYTVRIKVKINEQNPNQVSADFMWL